MTASKPSDGGHLRPVHVAKTRAPDPADLYAALDLGTNSCRMLIAQPQGSQFHVVDSFSKSVQLGRGLERHGSLSRATNHGQTRLFLGTDNLKLQTGFGLHPAQEVRPVCGTSTGLGGDQTHLADIVHNI